MNHKTRAIASRLYENWHDEVSQYAPPGSYLGTFNEQRKHFMRQAVKVKKSLEYRRGNHELCDYEG